MKATKNFLKGFFNKKILAVIFIIITIVVLLYTVKRVFFSSQKSSGLSGQNQKYEAIDQMNNPKQINGQIQTNTNNQKSAASIVVEKARHEEQCAICRSIIKSGAASPCMKALKCE